MEICGDSIPSSSRSRSRRSSTNKRELFRSGHSETSYKTGEDIYYRVLSLGNTSFGARASHGKMQFII